MICTSVVFLSVGCGKEGPPLPPLQLAPALVTNVEARRQVDEVRFTFVLPTRNQDGSTPVSLERVEVFAATVAAGAVVPTNRELLAPVHRAASIEVKPPPLKEGEEPEKKAGQPVVPKEDPRPGPGDTVIFVEQLTEAKLKPTYTKPPPVPPVATPTGTATGTATGAPVTTPGAPPPAGTPKPAPVPPAGAPTTPPAALPRATPAPPATAPATEQTGAPAATATAAAVSPVPKRIYVIRGVARGGRPGQPTTRIEIPLIDPPSPPGAVSAKFTDSAITLAWAPTVVDAAVTPLFNVYVPNGATPLNPKPLAVPAFERPGVEFGKEECFVVRTVQRMGGVSLESTPSERVCTTPTDVFPSAAPKGLGAVAGSGVISLIWDANTEPDLAGYIVLRGEAPGDTLQPLTPTPIRETTFRDRTVKPGVRYVYAIVAVDNATPPNTSAQSARVEETAR